MNRSAAITGDQLSNVLRALGVNFIMSGHSTDNSLHKNPARLTAALAESGEARLRLSLIPLFLEHPEFANYVREVAKKLDTSARLTLQCYYSAAIWLGKQHGNHTSLPDYFSTDLNLFPTNDPEKNLQELAKRHKELSGSQVNWLGTYEHAAQIRQQGLSIPCVEQLPK